MAILGIAGSHKTTILPEGGRDFLRRRLMELVGVAISAVGVLLLMAVFTFNASDPSLNPATGTPPTHLLGLPGAYVSDVLLQTFGLAIVLVPVALITWGVRLVRTHHLGFFGLRLSLLLLALLMMSVACVGLGDVGGAATHTGPGGLVGLALVGRFREIVLSHSSGGSLALIEPVCAALAFIAMAPALGMNRTDLPLIFRILRAPFIWSVWLFRAGVGLWRGRPQPFDESEPPAPEFGYAEIPGEIDASQYDPSRFEQIPLEGQPLPPRESLMVDAPNSPIERPTPDIPPAPAPLHPAAPPPAGDESVGERTLFDRLAGGMRIEPILGRLRAAPAQPAALPEEVVRTAPPPALPEEPAEAFAEHDEGDENPFTPDDTLQADQAAAPAPGVKIVPRKSAAAQGKRAAKAGQRELDL
ncbi:MAG: DNA translocase FtsK 4TM domain-containing protein, partial [Rhodospirillaceae bacterium]